MKYDFNRHIDRRDTSCYKWDAVESIFGTKEIIPMWVADMDFPIATEITNALKKRIGHEVYGYSMPSKCAVDSVVERVKRKYGWKIDPEWVVFTPGVVPVLYNAVKAFTHPGDEVIIQDPVYRPFFSAVTDNGCMPANNTLKMNGLRYEMDFDDLERKFRPAPAGSMRFGSRVKMMILCNPHNPVGRVWTREELTKLGEIMLRHKCLVISDEIHCELLMKGYKHIPFATLSSEFEQNCIVCMAASKTFNLAGIEASSIIIPNPDIRRQFNIASSGFMSHPNVLAVEALEAAYRSGDEWLEQLLEYLNGNLEFLVEYFEKNIPRIKVIKPEGTYLAWLDCRGLGLDTRQLRKLLIEKARVGLEDGFIFGKSGEGFQRINIACPRATLEEALKRIDRAVKNI
jgi:cysteine-S-conjugate beta-lyase